MSLHMLGASSLQPRGGAVVSLTIDPTSPTVEMGTVQAFSAIATDARGNSFPPPVVTWSVVPDTGSGTIDPSGQFRGTQPGTCTVTCRSGRVTTSTKVMVVLSSKVPDTSQQDDFDEEEGDDLRAETKDDIQFPRQGFPSFHANVIEVDPRPDTRLAMRRHYPSLAELENFPQDEEGALARDYEAAKWAGFAEDEVQASTSLLARPWWQPGIVPVAEDVQDPVEEGTEVGHGGGHGGGGHGHGHGAGFGRRGGWGGGPWGWGGPWYEVGPQYEIVDDFDDTADTREIVDLVAEAVADKLQVRGASTTVGGARIGAVPGQFGKVYGSGIRDGRGYGPYGAGYDSRLEVPFGPNGEKLSKEYDFQGGPLNWKRPKKVLPGFEKVLIGDITDTKTDYDNGERLCLEMNQYFTALGRPKEFEAQAEAVWAAYQNAKAGSWWTATEKFLNATKMKNAGIDAAKLTADLQKAYPAKAAEVPSANLPKPSKDHLGEFAFTVPWWVWAIVATGGIGVLGYFTLPILLPVLARRSATKLLSAAVK